MEYDTIQLTTHCIRK